MAYVSMVWGALGDGKTLYTISKISFYLRKGRHVATNFDLFLKRFPSVHKDSKIFRLPDRPLSSDLEDLPKANTTYDDSLNGILVLDEMAMWFNSKNARDEDHARLVVWFRHARKMGWDVFLISQHPDDISKSVRDGIIQQFIRVRNLKGVRIPFIGRLFPFARLPPIHTAVTRLGGFKSNSSIVERDYFKSRDYFHCYDTKQIFLPRNESAFSTHLVRVRFRCSYSRRLVMVKLKQWRNLKFLIPLGLAFFFSGTMFINAKFDQEKYQILVQKLQSDFLAFQKQVPAYQLTPDAYISNTYDDNGLRVYAFRKYLDDSPVNLSNPVAYKVEGISACLAKLTDQRTLRVWWIGCKGQLNH